LLKKAERVEPRHAAVNLNLGMALAEQGKMDEAEQHFRAALAADATLAQAAYNLGVLLNRTSATEEGVSWCRKAAELLPQNPAYVYTLAFYLAAQGRKADAAKVLRDALQRHVTSEGISALLTDLQATGP
jgi:Flp pilus assembly protein TadD